MPSSSAAEKISVYLVDDHTVLRRGVAALVNAQSDMAISGETNSPAVALRHVSQSAPHVVIIDLRFHECSGLELIARLRRHAPRMRILVFTICDRRTHAAEAFEAGANSYVMKSETPERLLSAIRSAGRNSPRTPRSAHVKVAGRVLRYRVRHARRGGLRRIEAEIIRLIGRGVCSNSIACQLHLTLDALGTYTHRIRRLLHLDDKTKFVEYCVRCVRNGDGRLAILL